MKTLWEKEKLLVTSNFSFSHSVFYPFEDLPAIFVKFEIICRLLQFGKKSLKLVGWARVKINLLILTLGFTTTTTVQRRSSYTWTAWSEWSVCGRGCGRETRERFRQCTLHVTRQEIPPEYCGSNKTKEVSTCNNPPCNNGQGNLKAKLSFIVPPPFISFISILNKSENATRTF